MSACQGCGAELPPNKAPGRPRKWCSDRCRKAQYSTPCIDCGAPTNGSDGRGPHASLRCPPCSQRLAHENAIWTREVIIECIRVWARENDGHAPAATDWNPSIARRLGHIERAEKFYDDDAWPHVSQVARVFGGWNAAIEAAGFVPRGVGCYDRKVAA